MTTTTNNIETKSIMTLASEQYVHNCNEDDVFATIGPANIAAGVRCDLEDMLGRKLTDSEDDMVDEALLLFGIEY